MLISEEAIELIESLKPFGQQNPKPVFEIRKELNIKQVCANFAHTTKHGSLANKTQTRITSL